MKTKTVKLTAALAVTCIALLGLSGCSEKTSAAKPDLDSDVEQLAKLPAMTSTALVLRGPAYVAAIGLLMLGIGGIKVKITKCPKEEEASDE